VNKVVYIIVFAARYYASAAYAVMRCLFVCPFVTKHLNYHRHERRDLEDRLFHTVLLHNYQLLICL